MPGLNSSGFPFPFAPDPGAPLPFVFVQGSCTGFSPFPTVPRGIRPMRATIWRNAKNYPVDRCTGGAFVDGRWIENPRQRYFVRASVQPIGGRDLLRLPQGERVQDFVTIYTDALLQTANVKTGVVADLLTWRGSVYEVQSTYDWEENGGFVKAIGKRMGQ